MFCQKCKKEIPEGAKWCPHCGTELKESGGQTEPGINGEQYTTQVQPRRKIQEISFWKVLLLSIVTAGIYMIYTLFCLAKDINTLCEGDGKDSPNYFIVILFSIITCGVYGIYWLYLQQQRLYEAADGYGTKVNDTGMVVLLWSTAGALLFGIGPFIALYKLIKNRNQIAGKYNSGVHNPQLNKTEKVKMGMVAKIFCGLGVLGFIATIVMAVQILIFFRSFSDDLSSVEQPDSYIDDFLTDMDEYYIGFVKDGTPSVNSGITYGEVFDNYLVEPVWEYSYENIEDGAEEDWLDDYQDIVEVSGYCRYSDEETWATLQFIIDEENNTFEAAALYLDNVQQDETIMSAFIEDAFASFETDDIFY
ncbi:MAG: DUF4234 domain-containing protein [Eubacterium sp.]|nr:DUF4234 domain-containing protein [Eubacterium sp.]